MDNLIQSLLNTHDNLDEIIRDPKGRVFISEWNCVNPYADQYIGNLNKIEIPPERETEYVYFKDDYYLSAMISEFHLQRGEQKYSRDEIIPGAGSTPLIASFCLWMVKNNIKEFFYIPPHWCPNV